MSTFLDKKINNNESSEAKSKSQEDFEKELEDFVAELEELKKSVESMWRIGRWWDCSPFKPFTWLNVKEFKDIADSYIQLVKNNNFEDNREQISELVSSTLVKMETHPSSKMRNLLGYCIGKSHGFQGTSYNNIKRQNELKGEIILKKDIAISELEQKIKESEKCVEERLRAESRQLKIQLDNKIQKLEDENQEYRTKISKLEKELRENSEERDREIEELKKENQDRDKREQDLKKENQERDKQIETLMKLCNTLSLAQMATQNVPNTEMSSVQLSQSLPSLEK
ncbi:hypothetical protein [Wolbachia endosymbiont of Folsomia candida]|uniref:hypothetical protein n=1 Tax=Wolbachia endosymbiont of Folsomia candida TaxID=169402 RepID=UPI000A9846E4|nr:hypothetical protein [Wolbachia endosymbiont of Folsomia candida]APR98922.1 hypothetical protein ASM33_06960 [Wolbachia endosymbiont of Folsomia candida]